MLNLTRPAHTAGGIFDRLDADWVALCADTSVQASVADWLMADGLGADVRAVADAWVSGLGPEQLLIALRPRGGAMADALADDVLRALLARAAGHDRPAVLAARIVVQAMVPAAVRIARGQVRSFGGRTIDDVGHLTIAMLFEVARSGRIHHRPGRPAANLQLDTLSRVTRELATEREELGEDLQAVEEIPGGADHAHQAALCAAVAAAGLEPGGTAASEKEVSQARLELLDLILTAVENGTLSTADAQAIAWHYRTDPLSDHDAAARTGTTAAAWQRRRSRAVARLKNAA